MNDPSFELDQVDSEKKLYFATSLTLFTNDSTRSRDPDK